MTLSEGDLNTLTEDLRQARIRYSKNVSMKLYSYFRTGGVAKIIIFPDSEFELALTLTLLKRKGVHFKVIGRTTNLLFLDDADYSAIVSTSRLHQIRHDSGAGKVYAEAGVDIADLARFFLSVGSSGFEGLEGIPGSLGGAVFMNASAYGSSLSTTLESVRVWDEETGFSLLTLPDLKLGYRKSVFHEADNKKVIIGAHFGLAPGDTDEIYRKMSLFHNKRHKYQEFMYPTLGSLFAGSVYRELAKFSLLYYMVSAAYYFFNYRFKIFRRESPDDRRWLNSFTEKVFDLRFPVAPYSAKDMNTLINNGQHTDVYIAYIEKMKELTKGKLKLENEIVGNF